ncbi:MAG TPA: ATP-dependent 6-phosphofructokinase [Steroidobacter sp.]|uniref:ATP-dependent 6-phosphofructokinase n=1 Tax=Steroidobacter sp. TaxID=1978227 RepID=UPI002EDA34A3
MVRVAVLTSGGDAPGMNAAIRAVVRCGVLQGLQMFGVRRGYAGLIGGDLTHLGPREVGGIVHVAGTMLETSRCEEFKTDAGQRMAVQQLHDHDISNLVVIGGNGSQAGSHALACRGIRVVGIASTIDNDLCGTDVSIGTTTALGTALDAIDCLRVTAASHERAFIVEVMGRHSGYLAVSAAIAGGAEAVIIPEAETSPEDLVRQLHASRERGKKHAIVVVAEGAKYNADALVRYFDLHAAKIGIQLRMTRLGHVQRGGTPGAFDRILASRLGAAAIDLIGRGQSGCLVGIQRGDIVSTPLSEVAGHSKPLDPHLLELARALAT